MKAKLVQAPAPELIFGLVAPIGVDLDLVSSVLGDALDEMKYATHVLRLTRLMKEVKLDLPLDGSPYIKSFKDRIAYANAIRLEVGDEALAAHRSQRHSEALDLNGMQATPVQWCQVRKVLKKFRFLTRRISYGNLSDRKKLR